MAREKIYIDKRRAKEDGTYPLKVYVWYQGRALLVSTVYSAKPENFEDGRYTKKEPNHRAKNAALANIMSKVTNEMFVIETTGEILDRSVLKKRLDEIVNPDKHAKCKEKDFLECFDEFMELKTNAGTHKNYVRVKKKILQFDKRCTFASIDVKWLTLFNAWMEEDGLKLNTRSDVIKHIKAVFNYAIDCELTTLYPFRKYKLKYEETRKRSLSVDKIRYLMNYNCKDTVVKYRDMFVLMMYLIGINAVDLFNAKKDQVVDGRLEYKRSKTKKLYSIYLEPEAMEIIERYKGEKYLLNVMETRRNYHPFMVMMDTTLKEIIPGISTYYARHSWATIASFLDVPKDVISKALGHRLGSPTTSIYIDYDMSKVDKANRLVIDYINGKDVKW